ncbi:tRNA (guanosine(37)-N1)-methyltransferase TrmD [Anaerocolumna sedimenticola]|uniref:tRNA (guanine-N(1)-)-methyltransferase n=1 Tax=Anaerocolumna sedimenticola TaxID=2696063 RepID=A0A6P1TR37_9FIRM|nr:tRNA (guanosine(37)-N1)-methyltransferase TrmD [Anaerocolumna sedimenticola]QHQ62216.1 tRNA (guanosine(37)-N1)-methyltransferase TrmD [Anaerocolumna sedimenticola]
MNFYVLTLFPEMIEQGLNTSIIGRALEKGLLSLKTVDIRNFSENKHNRVDDYPYGGGAGMVMAPGPVYRAHQYVEELIRNEKNTAEFTGGINITGHEDINDSNTLKTNTKKTRVIYLTPQGRVFNQTMAEEFAKDEDLIFLCGHYEGIDERILEMIVTDYVSIGDYVLTGGELPSMVMIDAIARLVPGVLNNDVSAEFESFQDNLLEYPQYTRPEVFMERSVPEILLSGHHAKIEEWRKQQSILRTANTRPDLLEKAVLTSKEKKFLHDYLNKQAD